MRFTFVSLFFFTEIGLFAGAAAGWPQPDASDVPAKPKIHPILKVVPAFMLGQAVDYAVYICRSGGRIDYLNTRIHMAMSELIHCIKV